MSANAMMAGVAAAVLVLLVWRADGSHGARRRSGSAGSDSDVNNSGVNGSGRNISRWNGGDSSVVRNNRDRNGRGWNSDRNSGRWSGGDSSGVRNNSDRNGGDRNGGGRNRGGWNDSDRNGGGKACMDGPLGVVQTIVRLIHRIQGAVGKPHSEPDIDGALSAVCAQLRAGASLNEAFEEQAGRRFASGRLTVPRIEEALNQPDDTVDAVRRGAGAVPGFRDGGDGEICEEKGWKNGGDGERLGEECWARGGDWERCGEEGRACGGDRERRGEEGWMLGEEGWTRGWDTERRGEEGCTGCKDGGDADAADGMSGEASDAPHDSEPFQRNTAVDAPLRLQASDADAAVSPALHRTAHEVAWACALCVETGCEPVRALESVRAQWRRSQEIEAKCDEALAMPRATERVLFAFPFVTLAAGEAMGARPLSFLFASRTGFVLLLAGVVLQLLGAAWMRRLVRNYVRNVESG